MRFPVIPSEARNPSSIKMPRKERFSAQKTCDAKPYLTSQTPFGITNSGFLSRLLKLKTVLPSHCGSIQMPDRLLSEKLDGDALGVRADGNHR